MTDLEIPLEKDRHGHYRFFEILPGALSWILLFTPLILSLINVTVAIIFVFAYLLIFFVRGLAYAIRALAGYRGMKKQMKLDWPGLVADIEAGQVTEAKLTRPKWHYTNLKQLKQRIPAISPSELTHAAIIATVNESREILEPTIQAVLNGSYDPKRIILVIAYEARAGQATEDRVKELIDLYGDRFKHSLAVKHPADIPNEIVGKGSNITHAGRALERYLKQEQLDPSRVVVTTLDADNRPDKNYFSALSYLFCVVPKPLQAAYQPLAMFTNNIWDAPTLMRVIATGNSLFYIVHTQRPHLSRNFSAHSQSMQALIDMDFWSVRTIVEDGHQFWRSYFHFDGDYLVYPLGIPIYQDAVLADGYWRSMKAQFGQLQRWTYGASDIAYVADKGFWQDNKVPKLDLLAKFLRLLENHVSWAAGSLLILGGAFMPHIIHPQNLAANQLPLIVSRIQRYGLVTLLTLAYVSLLILPPRPARYKRHRSIIVNLQWALIPVTGVIYGSSAAFYSQTRLMLRKYVSRFNVTEKANVDSHGKRHATEADPSSIKKLRHIRIFRRHKT